MSRLSSRLLFWFVLIAVSPLMAIMLVVLSAGRSSQIEQVYNLLTLAADNKIAQIETYAAERRQSLLTMVRSPTVTQIMRQIAVLERGTPAFRRIQADAMPFLTEFARTARYSDILLLNLNGDILISLQGTRGNIYQQPELSALARVVENAVMLLTPEISNFIIPAGGVPQRPLDAPLEQPTATLPPTERPPLPPEFSPAAYLAAPVYDDNIIVGVLAFQIDNNDLYRVITERVGLGETGETVTAARLDSGGVTITAPLRLALDLPFSLTIPDSSTVLAPLRAAVSGAAGAGEAIDYRGERVLAVWRYAPSLRWGLMVKVDEAEALAAVAFQRNTIFTVLLITLAAVSGAAFVVARSITRPLERLTRVVRAFSEGRLDARVSADIAQSRDEIGVLAAGFNQMAAQIADQVNFLEQRVRERTQQLAAYAEQMDNARREAERANQAKTIFLTNMSHELRTPLNAILGFAQVLERDTTLNAKQHEHVGIIMRSGEHLLNLINDVLEMSKIESGRATLNESVFDLPELLRGIEEMMQVRANAKQLQLLFEWDDDLPRYIRADEGKLRQILINLISNGIKFTKEGGVAVRAAAASDQRLIVEVEDTGHGIAPEEMDKLFKPFVQTESGRHNQEGTGLGLALSRQFAQLMGGDIAVRSQVGQGSTFTLTIRCETASAADLPEREAPRRVRAIDPNDTREYRILVVDDKWENRHLMSTWLTNVGFKVREAANGREAIAIWERWEPQLIWMDMRMPIMNGYEATRYIKSTDKGSATVVIALTASALEAEKASILVAGCDDFVRKPTRESIIMEKMAQHLGVKFVYEDALTHAPEMREELSAETIAALPAAWRARLSDAADQLDLEACEALVREIRAEHPAIAAGLQEWVSAFRFDKIQAILAEATR
jgi:signal transduction histidine kinase/CheY-like chemotaxis protein